MQLRRKPLDTQGGNGRGKHVPQLIYDQGATTACHTRGREVGQLINGVAWSFCHHDIQVTQYKLNIQTNFKVGDTIRMEPLNVYLTYH